MQITLVIYQLTSRIFRPSLRAWAGIGMQKSQYYKLFRGSFKNYVGICVKFEQCNHSSFNTHMFLWSTWVVDGIEKSGNSCITKNVLLLNDMLRERPLMTSDF